MLSEIELFKAQLYICQIKAYDWSEDVEYDRHISTLLDSSVQWQCTQGTKIKKTSAGLDGRMHIFIHLASNIHTLGMIMPPI